MSRDAYRYAPYYCEENIWHLCQEDEFRRFQRKVMIISNERRSCPLWNQRACIAPGEPVFWDYHVAMLFENEGWQVYDLDTLLSTPTPMVQYLESTFAGADLPAQFRPIFRLIDADEFVSVFSSDRSHMKDGDGNWLVAPPPWRPIIRNQRSNLMDLIDMQTTSFGQTMDLAQLEAAFGY